MATEAQIKANRENAKKAGRKPGTKGNHTMQAEEAKAYIIKRVTEELEPIMDKAIEQAKAGDVATRRDLMDRAYGRPKETLEVVDKTLKLDV